MMEYRIATGSDAPAIAALAREIWVEHYTPLIGAQQVEYMLGKFQSAKGIETEIASGVRYHVAREGGGMAGYLALRPEPNYLFLSKLYVRKEHRGHGIARQFVRIAQAMAEELSLPRIRLTVNKGNGSSIQAYLRMGFAKTDEAVTDIGNGYVMDDYIMELPIASSENRGFQTHIASF